MRPEPPQVMLGMAGVLGAQVAPELQTPFGLQTVGSVAGILAMIAQDYDRAAARLVEENDAIVGLLMRATRALPMTDLRRQVLSELGRPANQDLHVSKLLVENDRLRRILIDVHAALELLPDEDAEQMNEEIWEELRESTRRRHLAR